MKMTIILFLYSKIDTGVLVQWPVGETPAAQPSTVHRVTENRVGLYAVQLKR